MNTIPAISESTSIAPEGFPEATGSAEGVKDVCGAQFPSESLIEMGNSKRKAPTATIPDIQWSNDMVWQLIDQIERNENRVVLLGKWQKGNKTSGDSKVAVYQRIGAAVLPTYHAINAIATGDRGVKSSNGAKDDEPDEYFDCYIPVSGPDVTTTTEAQSIWDEIVEAFPFFPALHRIFSTRPNVTPIAITTGVGPHGKKTVHFQPLSDDESDPPAFMPAQNSQMLSLHQLLQAEQARRQVSPASESVNDGGSPPWHDWDKENIPSSEPQPTGPLPQSASTPVKRPPKPSSIAESVDKAKEHIQKSAALKILLWTYNSEANLDAINLRAEAEMRIQEHQLLLKGFKAGVWDASEYKEKLGELMARPAKCPHQAAGGE
ncbi:hypothetical protein BU15DRAFT_81226 [Melanogaster broomeanus]|nr:hypothetical protein BU15DRAFT_81226 [Melanogaster broomeanus]